MIAPPTRPETSVERFDALLLAGRRPVRFEQWDRRLGIGASEWIALAGVSPWATPASVWLDKMDLGTFRETDAMRAGRDLETTVLRMAADQLQRRLVHNRMTFRHPDWPAVPLFATPDGFTHDGVGVRSLVEIKVVGHRFDDWKSGPPTYVDWQVQGQLACLPRIQSGIVAALVGGAVKTWRVERDPEVQEMLPGLVAEWWQRHIVGNRAPDPTTDDDRWSLLRARIRDDGRRERIATPDEQRAGTEMRNLLAARALLDDQIDRTRLTLATWAADSDVLGVGWKATWATRQTVDWRALATHLAIPQDEIDGHTRTTSAFTFRQGKDPTE